MEVLACCLLDPGDVILTPSPCYTRIFVNFSERFNVSVVDVLLRDKTEVCLVYRSTSNICEHAGLFWGSSNFLYDVYWATMAAS